MDDLIWISPEPNGAVGDCWHNACTEPRPGFICYVRLDTMADAADREKQAGAERRKQTP